MRPLAWLLVLCLLVGCSLSPAIDASVSDYFQVSDLATNRSILLNILRAKDGAPLHFSELSQVRGQMTAGGTATVSFPFGPEMHASSPRELAALSGTVSSSPSFDVVSLDTKDFTDGIMAQISPATVKFFLDEGIDYPLVLLLVMSGVRTPTNAEMILNAPESSRYICYPRQIGPLQKNEMPLTYTIIAAAEAASCPGKSEPEFLGFLRVVDNLRRVYATSERGAPQPVGPPFAVDMRTDLRALAGMDPTKYRLAKLPSGQYQIEQVQRHETVLLCQESSTPGGTPSVLAALDAQEMERNIPPSACVLHAPGEAVPPDHADTHTPYVFTLRSTLEVVQYIGRVLAFQEAETATLHRPRCITLRFEQTDAGCAGNIMFNLQHDAIRSPIELAYDGQTWAVPAASRCDTGPAGHCDHTLETMAMVALLLNQNKSSRDIPKTPAFEAVP